MKYCNKILQTKVVYGMFAVEFARYIFQSVEKIWSDSIPKRS